ncbi:MAG: hypothetical protein HY001_00650 [Candidatus Portnoybacteria bacterium]|nr:hypothetical protein [Candidatus Portnoybacteria bacterium]
MVKRKSNYQSSKPYPYLPKNRVICYTYKTDKFIRRAKEMVQNIKEQYPWARYVTASVVVKDGKIIGKAANRDVHFSFCPRRVFQSPSGEDYHLCPRHCHPNNHSELLSLNDAARKGGKDASKGASLYMYGHWWCCKPCWDAMAGAGIKDIYLIEGATELFGSVAFNGVPRSFYYYAASAVTGSKTDTLKSFHQEVANILKRVNVRAYLPWAHTDPVKHPHFTPSQVYEKNAKKIQESDFVLAHLGEPSLRVGVEIELARRYRVPVIGFASKGAKVSRMALGAPSLKSFFFFNDIKDFIVTLSEALEDSVSNKALRK